MILRKQPALWAAALLLVGCIGHPEPPTPIERPGRVLIQGWIHTLGPRKGELYRSSDRLGHALWNIFSDRGLTVGVVNWLITYPSEKVNGVLVSDMAIPVAAPTERDVAYGPHPSQRLDLWTAPGDGARPLLVMIHGGGWVGGDKKTPWPALTTYLSAGISVARINYRLAPEHPLPAPVHDAARAVQFLRMHAERWNLDPQRVAAVGRSAGGTTALWLALHDDLADPESPDPVRRESTRLIAAGAGNAPTSLEPDALERMLGKIVLDHPMLWQGVGAQSSATLREKPHRYESVLREFSPLLHLDAGDPPIFVRYQYPHVLPPSTINDAIHHPAFGLELKALSESLGHECHILSMEVTDPGEFPGIREFLINRLTSR